MNKKLKENFYKKILLIRNFENLLLNLFEKGELSGTTHTSIGQEFVSVCILNDLSENDFILSNHRCHAHFLTYSNEYDLFFKELIGDKNGICKGRGGSQHILFKNFISNGVLGNLLPVASGIALSNKVSKKKGIVFVFLGDGTFGEGVVYETLNLCSLLNLKCFFIVENNKIAQSTPLEKNFAGSFIKRFESFNIDSEHIKPKNIEEFYNKINKLKLNLRKKSRPYGLIVDVPRLSAHSKGDDTRTLREIQQLKKIDLLTSIENSFSEDFIQTTKKGIEKKLNKIITDNKINYKYEIS